MKSPIDDWAFSLRFIAAFAVLGILNAVLLPWETSLRLLSEGGLIEDATVVFYYVALLVLWTCAPRGLARSSLVAISVVLIASAAREMDLHIALFGMSILKANFYRKFATGPQIVIALLVILPVLLSVGFLVVQHGRWLLNGTRRRIPTAVTTSSIFVLLVVVKILDRSLGMVQEIGGYAPPLALRVMQLSLEEPLEMLPAILVITAIAQAWRTRARDAT